MDENEIEVPDLGDTEDALVSLESVAVDIDAFLSNVRETGGVSRTMAEKAAHLLPADTNYAYYSATPTQTQLKVTLEAIDVKQALLIVAAVAAVAALAVKVFQYIKKSREKVDFAIKWVDSRIVAIERCFTVTERLIGKLDADGKQKAKEIHKELTDKYTGQMNEIHTVLVMDVISNGKVSHALHGADQLATKLYSRLKYCVGELDSLTNGHESDIKENLMIDVADMALPNSLSAIHTSNADKAGPAMSEIATAHAKLQETKVKFNTTFEEAFKKYGGNTGSNSKMFKTSALPHGGELQAKLEAIDKRVAKKKDFDPEQRRELNKVSYALRSGVQQLMAYSRMVTKMAYESRMYWSIVDAYATAYLKRISALALETDNEDVKEALSQAAKNRV